MEMTFISKKLNKEVTLSETQQKALDNLCFMNYHSEVRVALAEVFHAPKYIKIGFRRILTHHQRNGSLDWKDSIMRNNLTIKFNNFIKRNYGFNAYKFVLSVQ